jgi:hypothetical protein
MIVRQIAWKNEVSKASLEKKGTCVTNNARKPVNIAGVTKNGSRVA